MKNHQASIKFTIIFILLFIGLEYGFSSEKQTSDPFANEESDAENEKIREIEIMRFGKTGSAALSKYQKAIVVGYKASPPELYGFSGNTDGVTIKKFKLLSKDEATLLQKMLLDQDNLNGNYALSDVQDLVWGQGVEFTKLGVEFTNGSVFMRVYFTSDGQWCIVQANAGESSATWKCSTKLRDQAKALIKKLNTNE